MKKIIYEIIYILIASILILNFFCAHIIATTDEEKECEGFKYKVEAGAYVIITKYVGNDLNVVIPDTIENLPVKEISDSAFAKNELIQTVKILEGVRKLGYGAFEQCLSLTEILLPNSLKEIGNYAFRECTAIKEIKLPDEMTELGYGIFKNCVNLEKINYPIKLGRVGTRTFEGCEKLTHIEIPEGVTILASFIFSYSELKSVKLPSTLKEIGYGTFEECRNLETIEFPEGLYRIEGRAFKDCAALKSITIPKGCNYIGGGAFENCVNLEEIVMPDNVGFSESSFKYCDKLTFNCKRYSYSTISLIRSNFKNIKFYDETKPTTSEILKYNRSYYVANTSKNNNAGNVTVTCKYSTNEDYPYNKWISIKLPNDSELIDESLRINEELCENLKRDMENNIINIPIENANGKITFDVKTQENSKFISYAVMKYDEFSEDYEYMHNQEILGVINNEISNEPIIEDIVGDIDGNEKITTKDAKMVLQHIVKKITLTEKQQIIADVDGNEKITTKDAKLILQYIVKKISKFPVEG